MKLVHINNNFDEEVKNYDGICIVDFWAPWCGPCKMLGPIFEDMSKKAKNIKFCKLNVDENDESISKEFGVMSIPTIILFKNGKEVKRNTGFINNQELEKFIGETNV